MGGEATFKLLTDSMRHIALIATDSNELPVLTIVRTFYTASAVSGSAVMAV